MKNIFKKWGTIISIAVVAVVVVVGHLWNNEDKGEVKNNNKVISKKSNNSVLSSGGTKRSIEYNEKESTYKEIESLENILNDQYFILINRENKLSEDYVPNNLKKSEGEFLEYVEDNELESNTADAVKRMFDSAKKDGISLVGVSGYRSYSVQKLLYDTRVENKGEEKTRAYTAEAGESEHQSGLAIDILCSEYEDLDEEFENTEAFKWLMDNCYKYGFILRYLKGKEDITGYNYEPWHFRYIGNVEVAKDIMNRGLTFEEYINEVKNRIEELRNIK